MPEEGVKRKCWYLVSKEWESANGDLTTTEFDIEVKERWIACCMTFAESSIPVGSSDASSNANPSVERNPNVHTFSVEIEVHEILRWHHQRLACYQPGRKLVLHRTRFKNTTYFKSAHISDLLSFSHHIITDTFHTGVDPTESHQRVSESASGRLLTSHTF